MIRRVELNSFKGFREFTIPLSPFTNVIGLNGRGKTSILQAIRFAYELLRLSFQNNDAADFSTVDWHIGPHELLMHYSLDDAAAVWFGRNTSEPCVVKLDMTDDVTVEAKVLGPSRARLDILIRGKSLRNLSSAADRTLIQHVLRQNVIYVPPLGATSSTESWMSHVMYKKELQRGRYAETWRNSL